jgi:hypothetical protein
MYVLKHKNILQQILAIRMKSSLSESGKQNTYSLIVTNIKR